jgi:hypothetical protein
MELSGRNSTYFCHADRPLMQISPSRPMRLAGGESGIRTHGTLRYTRFPSVRLKPLGHLSGESFKRRHHLNLTYLDRLGGACQRLRRLIG